MYFFVIDSTLFLFSLSEIHKKIIAWAVIIINMDL